MPLRSQRQMTAAALGLLALLAARRARAEGAEKALLVLGFIAPADVGVALADPTSPRFVIGWSYQMPTEIFTSNNLRFEPIHHRIVPSFELLPRAGGVDLRGRLGYRYDRSHVFGGLGAGGDAAGVTVSPEIGVKFLDGAHAPEYGLDLSLHLLARAEIAPQTGHLRGMTFLLGWNLI